MSDKPPCYKRPESVLVVVYTRTARVLLLKRADHPHFWQSVTGALEWSESEPRLAAAPELVDVLRIVRLPYHLSAVTQAVARAALRHRGALMAQIAELRAERDRTVTWLREQGLTVADSDANFVLFGHLEDRERVWQGLLDRGVLIRVVGPPGWLRVSIGTAAEMAAFRVALQEVLGL